MAKYTTQTLMQWLYADGTHEVVIDMVVRELFRRAECGEG